MLTDVVAVAVLLLALWLVVRSASSLWRDMTKDNENNNI